MVAFQIFWFSVYWYGIFYFISFILLYLFLFLLWKKKIFQFSVWFHKILTTELDTLMIFLLLWVLVWWRLGHFLIYSFDSLLANPFEFFQIWHWWMSFIWGICGVVISLLIFKIKKHLSWNAFLILLDCLLIFDPVGIFLWRLWNYLNQELYGIVFSNPWFSDNMVQFLESLNFLHVYPKIDHALRINTNLLSMIFEWCFIFILQMTFFFKMLKNKTFEIWKLTFVFVEFYSVFRFLFEYLRNDSQSEFIWIFTKSQRFFVFFFILGFVLFYSKNRKTLPLSL